MEQVEIEKDLSRKNWEKEEELLEQELEKLGKLEDHTVEFSCHPEVYDKNLLSGERCMEKKSIDSRYATDHWHFPFPEDKDYIKKEITRRFQNRCLTYFDNSDILRCIFGSTISGLFSYKMQCNTKYDKPHKKLFFVQTIFCTAYYALKFMSKFYDFLDLTSKIKMSFNIFDTLDRIPVRKLDEKMGDLPIRFYGGEFIKDPKVSFSLVTTYNEVSSNPNEVTFNLIKHFNTFISPDISLNISDEELHSLIKKMGNGDLKAFGCI
jgi:hypothetical protein